jgi:hypothetical protein
MAQTETFQCGDPAFLCRALNSVGVTTKVSAQPLPRPLSPSAFVSTGGGSWGRLPSVTTKKTAVTTGPNLISRSIKCVADHCAQPVEGPQLGIASPYN